MGTEDLTEGGRTMLSMGPRTALIPLVFCIAFQALSATCQGGAIEQGDAVRISNGPAAVKVGEEVLATLQEGTVLEAHAVQGEWVKVAVRQDESIVEGWIHKSRLSRLEPGEAEMSPENVGRNLRTGIGVLGAVLAVLLPVAIALVNTLYEWLHSKRDQKLWDKWDLSRGRDYAERKMAKRRRKRELRGWLGVALPCLASLVLGVSCFWMIGAWGILTTAVALLAGGWTFATFTHKVLGRRSYLRAEEQALQASGAEEPQSPRAEGPAGPEEQGEWLVRTPSGKLFKTADRQVVVRAHEQGKLPDECQVRAPGSEDWRPLGEVIS